MTTSLGFRSAIKLLVAAAVCLPLVGCSTLNEKYVAADEATYGAISAEYLDYVMRDPALDPWQRKLRHRTVKSWRARLDEAKKHLEQDQ